MEAFETFEHAGLTCELHQDEDPCSPAEWDQLGTMFSFTSEHALQGFGEIPGGAFEAWNRDRPGLTIRYLAAQGLVAVLFRLADYGSSGSRIQPLDDDDDGQATGYIATTRARFEELCGPWGYKPDGYQGTGAEWLVHTLTAELAEWDHYVAGEVCGYVVRDGRGEVAESVWGFYPDDGPGDGLDYLRAEARSAAESERATREAKQLEMVRGWSIAHKLPAGAL